MINNRSLEISGVRKAAVLVRAMSPEAAELVLARLSREQADELREMMQLVGVPDSAEESAVLREFLNGPRGRDNGVTFDRVSDPRRSVAPAPQRAEPPFAFLLELKPERTARLLADERPQIVAVVLSHLPKRLAGKILVGFAPKLQADVLRRLADLGTTDPDVLAELERGILLRMASVVEETETAAAQPGVGRIKEIIEESSERVGGTLLGNLAEHDRTLADSVAPRQIRFDQLTHLDGDTLATIVEELDEEILLFSLIGAEPYFVERVIRELRTQEAEHLRYRLANLGPMSLQDVEESRRRFCETARQMAMAGRIRLPGMQPSDLTESAGEESLFRAAA